MGYILPATKVTMFGFTFDSKDEFQRYLELREAEKFGEIKDLRVHPPFPIEVYDKNGERHLAKNYTPDFSYVVVKTDELRVEDVKSLSIKTSRHYSGKLKTKRYGTANEREWKLTKRLFRIAYGYDVREILMNRSIRSSTQR